MTRLVKISGSAVGARIGNTGFGINLSAGFHIAIKHHETDVPVIFSVTDNLSFGSASGTFIGSFVHTDWFEIDTQVAPLFGDPRALVGKHLGVLIKGTLFTSGTVDVKIEAYDRFGHAQKLLHVVNVRAKGMQVASSAARGSAKRWAAQLVEEAMRQEASAAANFVNT